MNEIKWIIEDKRDRVYSYHSVGGATHFTWRYDLIKQFNTKEEAEKHADFIKKINKDRILVVRDNKKITRKEKLRKLNEKTENL